MDLSQHAEGYIFNLHNEWQDIFVWDKIGGGLQPRL